MAEDLAIAAFLAGAAVALSRRVRRLRREASASPDGRPWWRKWRWRSAGLAWLAVVFVLTAGPFLLGPLRYLSLRGFVPFWCFDAVRAVVSPAVELTPLHDEYVMYVVDWTNRAMNERMRNVRRQLSAGPSASGTAPTDTETGP